MTRVSNRATKFAPAETAGFSWCAAKRAYSSRQIRLSVSAGETEQKDGLSTTILQQAGSILLEVEKRAVKHFEVETPYLAAVVKGTQFRVSVNKDDSSVDVLRGEVEVAGFKSGQYTTVRPGQAARVATEGRGDLSLSGSGTLSPIQQGEPHQSSITPIPVPQEGLSAPASAPMDSRFVSYRSSAKLDRAPRRRQGPPVSAPRASGTSSPVQQSQFRQSSADPPAGLKQGVSVAGGAPSGQQVRIAAAPGGVEAHPVRSEASAADESADEDANENTWGFGCLGGETIRAVAIRSTLITRSTSINVPLASSLALASPLPLPPVLPGECKDQNKSKGES